MRRMNNQDSLAVVVTDDAAKWASRGHLLMVADGMGAHAAGELASKLAVDNIPHTYFKLRDLYPPAALRQAIRDANALIYAKGQSNIGFQGMGTTCSCLVLLPQGALVAHVGDSRVYRLRGHRLAQLTFDHSLVWEMAAAGHMAEEDVPSYIPKERDHPLAGPARDREHRSRRALRRGRRRRVPALQRRAQRPDSRHRVRRTAPLPDAGGSGADAGRSGELARRAGQHLGRRGSRRGRWRAAGEAELAGTAGHRRRRRLGCREPRSMLLQATSVAALFALAFCLVNKFWTAADNRGRGLAHGVGTLDRRPHRRNGGSQPSYSLGGPYGNGPYRDTPCEPSQKVVASLAEMAEKLRNLPEGHGIEDRLEAAR